MEKKKTFCEQISVMKTAGKSAGKARCNLIPRAFSFSNMAAYEVGALFARFCFVSFLDSSVVFIFRDKPSATQQESLVTWKPKYVYLDLLA